MLANSYDREAKQLNGTHKSHVHSPREVCLSTSLLSHTHAFICKLLNSVMVSG